MKNPGYIYVLVNPAMEGLVKIGRTERDPHERAKELSTATGVPTPFIVVYDSFFEDCIEAEQFIHATLELKGYRLTNNKEFFNCTSNEAIKTVIEAQSYMASIQTSDDYRQNESEVTPVLSHAEPWSESFKLALAYYFGEGEFLQDYDKAVKYFKQSVKLGSTEACMYLGHMYENGIGVAQDLNGALAFYTDGSTKGNQSCFAYMAMIYFELGHFDNSLKCWEKYFATDEFIQNLSGRRAQVGWDSYKHDIDNLNDLMSLPFNIYIKALTILVKRDNQFYKVRDELISFAINLVNDLGKKEPYNPLKGILTDRLILIQHRLCQRWNITITEFDDKGFKGFFRKGSLLRIVAEVLNDSERAAEVLKELPASFELRVPNDQIDSIRSKIEDTGAKITIDKI